MTAWAWAGISLGATALLYAGFVVWLVVAGRRGLARAVLRFVPDCLVLFRRLLADPRVPRRKKALLVLLIGYLASPIDFVPDFVPVAGYLDDAVLVALVLRRLVRGSGRALIEEHWPGTSESRELILRLAGVRE